jgi:lanosterol synthase
VECTASALEALGHFRRQFPQLLTCDVSRAMRRAERRLRRAQRRDGSFEGVWGVRYIYGTMFGVRGLVAAGAPPGDPALRRACRFLERIQHADGAFGELHSLDDGYVPHAEPQPIHTAWALIALSLAGDARTPAARRAAEALLRMQTDAGAWPRRQMAGVFFRSALLEYELYRFYFPLMALGLHRSRLTGGHTHARPEGREVA